MAQYTIPQAAQKLGLSECRVRRAIQQGELHTVKVKVTEKVWRHEITEDSLTAWRKNVKKQTKRTDGLVTTKMFLNPADKAKLLKLMQDNKITYKTK